MRLAHGRHGRHGIGEVGEGRRHRQVRRHVVVGSLGALLFQGAEALVVLLFLFAVADDRVTFLTRLVGAAVPVGVTCQPCTKIRVRGYGTYCARLSEREKALLHRGQTYGRSCVCVRTCLSAGLIHTLYMKLPICGRLPLEVL